MDANENNRSNVLEEIIVLGVASVETQGGGAVGEPNGDPMSSGIAEE